MKLIDLAVRQPITITVGVLLSVLAGLVALREVPIQMTPSVDSVVVAITTYWENASASEIESDVIEEQEQRLGDLSGLVSMTSISRAGAGSIRLEFMTGIDIDAAMAEVDQKLSEVPGYPVGVDEPQIEDVDPDSVDYIAWVALSTSDPEFDASTLHDFMERRLRPRLERIDGISQVGMVGTREREVHIVVDPEALARRGLTYAELLQAIDLSNDNYSGGKLTEGKSDIRIRTVGRFHDVDAVGDLVLRREAAGAVYLRDVAEVREEYKELANWARARGHLMPFFNFQLAYGANLLETVGRLSEEFERLNREGGLLDQEAARLGIDGDLRLVKTYDATTYVNDALELVRSNILVGGILATLTLLLFLRSLRTVGIIGIAIPISVIASIVVLVALGRTMNIVSLAGMAFAVGMVVDNAIVVIENIYRHLEMGKGVRAAAADGAKEVGGAVLASTLTTLVVFAPILLIQDAAGQLFRDIALAIMASVGLSLVVSLTVIPAAAATFLRPGRKRPDQPPERRSRWRRPVAVLALPFTIWGMFPRAIRGIVSWLSGGVIRTVATIAVFAIGTLLGIAWLLPPLDYLPAGNRNIVFGILIPPPSYSLAQLERLGDRLQETMRPAWEAAGDRFEIETRVRGGAPDRDAPRAEVPLRSGGTVVPPPIGHYFMVAREGQLFHGSISDDKDRVIDVIPLMNAAAGGLNAPDVISFSLQLPLFRTGGTTGSAVKIDVTGDDLSVVERAAGTFMMRLLGEFGPYTVNPEPSNFLLPTPELRFVPDDERLQDLGMARRDVGLAVQANSDGIFLPRQFELSGELKDLKIVSPRSVAEDPIPSLLATPLSTPGGRIVDLRSVSSVERVTVPDQIKHINRQRGVTLELTPPPGTPLQTAIERVQTVVGELRADGTLPTGVEVALSGSAGKLADIKQALLGDGTVLGTITSSLFLALLIVYLLMVVLFQSWLYPVVIMMSVPLATLGGFAALALVHGLSAQDRYMPVQNLDVLTILGFVILAGVVVNNAILIVHQSLHFVLRDGMPIREGIAAAVESRVRPIAMSMLTSVGGMLPLVLMPGSGSELYRGLGAVVVGGLVVSTVFTLFLVPVLLHALMVVRPPRGAEA